MVCWQLLIQNKTSGRAADAVIQQTSLIFIFLMQLNYFFRNSKQCVLGRDSLPVKNSSARILQSKQYRLHKMIVFIFSTIIFLKSVSIVRVSRNIYIGRLYIIMYGIYKCIFVQFLKSGSRGLLRGSM